jgi:hypothetical protein
MSLATSAPTRKDILIALLGLGPQRPDWLAEDSLNEAVEGEELDGPPFVNARKRRTGIGTRHDQLGLGISAGKDQQASGSSMARRTRGSSQSKYSMPGSDWARTVLPARRTPRSQRTDRRRHWASSRCRQNLRITICNHNCIWYSSPLPSSK